MNTPLVPKTKNMVALEVLPIDILGTTPYHLDVAEATRCDSRNGSTDLPGDPKGYLSFPEPISGCHHRANFFNELSGSMPSTRILKAKARRGKGPQCGDVGHGINKCVGLPPLDLLCGNGVRGKGDLELG